MMLFSENRPDESFYSKLDSSLKKNTAFVRKLVSDVFLLNDSFIKKYCILQRFIHILIGNGLVAIYPYFYTEWLAELSAPWI